MSELRVTTLQHEAAAASNITLAANGNVGIGTSSPAYKLDVSTTSGDTQAAVYDRATGGSAARFDIRTSGTGASNWFIQTGNTASGLAGSLRFYDQNVGERMRIDSAGRVTMPYQPSIRFGRNAGDVGAGSVIVFNSQWYSVGSDYNSTNGRFTAPISGRYIISFNGFTTNNSQTQVYIRINGSVYGYSLYYGGVYGMLSQTTIANLTALDYIEMFVSVGTVYATSSTDCTLTVQLLS